MRSAIATAVSVVEACAISSTPGMNGAGFEKCTPRNRDGSVTNSASRPIEMVDVLLPITASGRAALLMRASVGPLMSTTSGTASSMKSAFSTASSMEGAGRRFFSRSAVAPAGNRSSRTKSSDSFSSRS